ncbi:MAG: DUF2851 family protein [Chloroflexi bacterium]|nr:DUF2851 family protein [Chloroflexota bacterium]
MLSEDALADIWELRAHAAHYLVDCCGRHLRVVFAGRRWGGPGPDFVGAVLADASGQLIRGDVEVHVRASSWAAHRHAGDPAYAGVVLHVVQVADVLALDGRGAHVPTVQLELPPALRHGAGADVPTVQLEPSPALGQAGSAAWPPRVRPPLVPCVRDAAAVVHIVEAAGRERFRARVARFAADLRLVDADQVVWRGVCEALGFRRNTQPFGQLADAVPWSLAAEVVADRGPVGLAGLLLGSAGLVAEATLPEAHAWRALQRSLGVRPALQRSNWDRRQVRAANAPEQRCRGLAELAARWTSAAGVQRDASSTPGTDTFRDLATTTGAATRSGPAKLHGVAVQRGASVASGTALPPGQWLAEHILERVSEAATARSPKLWQVASASPWIGRGRAQVIAVNTLLPFAAAAGMPQAAALFDRLPGEPSNRIVRYMAELLGGSGVRFRGACHQQGLLHLFKFTCAARVCERCPARATSPTPRTSKD